MNELKNIAEINEEIKHIITLAEDISLTATNAILVARQAGVNAVGFSVVARELRLFSEKIALEMQTLSQLIYQQVILTATKRHKLRNLTALNKASANYEITQTYLATACIQGQVDLDAIEQRVAEIVILLRTAIKRIIKQCASGIVIVRSAEIESAHGGTMTFALRQVAHDIEGFVSRITVQIKKLEKHLMESGA